MFLLVQFSCIFFYQHFSLIILPSHGEENSVSNFLLLSVFPLSIITLRRVILLSLWPQLPHFSFPFLSLFSLFPFLPVTSPSSFPFTLFFILFFALCSSPPFLPSLYTLSPSSLSFPFSFLLIHVLFYILLFPVLFFPPSPSFFTLFQIFSLSFASRLTSSVLIFYMYSSVSLIFLFFFIFLLVFHLNFCVCVCLFLFFIQHVHLFICLSVCLFLCLFLCFPVVPLFLFRSASISLSFFFLHNWSYTHI